jgi:hypothetical protein
MKVRVEADRQVAQVVDGYEYRADKGYFDMPDHHAKAHLKASNLPSPAAAGPVGRKAGYRCVPCGFGSFFTTCGRCGGPCVRE